MSSPPSDSHDPFNTQRPTVHELGPARTVLFTPLVWLLQLYFRTWRISLDEDSARALRETPLPRLIVVWHNRSLPMPEVFRRFFDPTRLACLISPSRMAAWEVAFFRRFRLRVVRGSTTRRSIQAARELFRELRGGHDVGISPDGPSGPLYSFQPGAVAIARKAGVPLLLAIPNCRQAIRLKTWDRHMVPWPFARLEVRIRAILPDDPLWQLPQSETAEAIRQVCLEITEDPAYLAAHE